MIASIPSATLLGATGRPVSVEVFVGNGVPTFSMVGLPDASAREARDRVRAAMSSTGFDWPQRRITVNLAPAGVRKGGAGLDLPIAVGVLVASGTLPAQSVAGMAFAGELGLDGSLRHVPGMISLSDVARGSRFVVPESDADEASLVRRKGVLGMPGLRSVVAALRGEEPWPPVTIASPVFACDGESQTGEIPIAGLSSPTDLSDVKGQRVGRRALEVAAAGGHHILFIGPPGSGKSMLVSRLTSILPNLSRAESLEVCRINSAAGVFSPLTAGGRRPPYRAPHCGASPVSMIGGGTASMRPGEISLAHNGVLFLDELAEFPAVVLEALRQPLEEGAVRVSRARGSVTYPARILLAAAMNPCPCGEGMARGMCRCSRASRDRYSRRLSGPLFDRFSLVVPLERTEPDQLIAEECGEVSESVAVRVRAARCIANERGFGCNSDMAGRDLDRWAPLTPSARSLLEAKLRSGMLSGRGLDRVRTVARTVADLAGCDTCVDEMHVSEALALRAGRAVVGMDQ